MRPDMRAVLIAGLVIVSVSLLVFVPRTEEQALPVRTVVPETSARDEVVREQVTGVQTAPTVSAPLRAHAFVSEESGSLESLMEKRRTDGLLDYTSRSYPSLGSFVESIDGLKNQGGSYWMLYINGMSASVGMSQAAVVPGDHIEWRYE